MSSDRTSGRPIETSAALLRIADLFRSLCRTIDEGTGASERRPGDPGRWTTFRPRSPRAEVEAGPSLRTQLPRAAPRRRSSRRAPLCGAGDGDRAPWIVPDIVGPDLLHL